jgi:hypothetical protein
MKLTSSLVEPCPTSRARLWRLINLAFALLAALSVAGIALSLSEPLDDSRQYRQAARNLLALNDPYATTGGADASLPPYPNPPLLAYLLVPTLGLGEEGGRLAWLGLNVAALAALIWLSLRVARPPGARYYWGMLAFGVSISAPAYLCLLLGQLGVMLSLLLVASFALAVQRPSGAGAALALAAAIKLYPALPGLFFLLRGPRRVVWWAALWGAGLLALPLLFHGLRPYQSYVETVLLGNFYPYAAPFNISLTGLWQRLLTEVDRFVPLAVNPGLAALLNLLSSGVVLALCVWATRAPGELGRLLAYSMWLCAMLLLSPVNGYYNLIGVLLPLLVIVRALARYPSQALSVATVLATALICVAPGWALSWATTLPALDRGWGLLLRVPALWGLCGYLVILALLVRRHGADAG